MKTKYAGLNCRRHGRGAASTLATVTLSLLAAAAARSQDQAPTGPAHVPSPDQATWVAKAEPCPASGYARPRYGLVGRNGGDGPAATEAASPCNPRAVLDAALAIGMGRAHTGSPYGVKNVVTMLFDAAGTYAGMPVKSLEYQVHYGLPASRLMIVRDGAKPDIEVFNDARGWNETSEGVGATPAPGTAHDRQVLIKLTPFGALWSAIEAEGHVKVAKVKGQTVLTGTSPYDGLEVTTTLDEKNLPATVSVKDGKTVYGASFSGYRKNTWGAADYNPNWEPDYGVVFPTHIVWTRNGKPLADLTVTGFKSNAYVVFPVPDSLKTVASN